MTTRRKRRNYKGRAWLHLRQRALNEAEQALGNDEAATQEGAAAIHFFEEANLPHEVERTRREVGSTVNGSQ